MFSKNVVWWLWLRWCHTKRGQRGEACKPVRRVAFPQEDLLCGALTCVALTHGAHRTPFILHMHP